MDCDFKQANIVFTCLSNDKAVDDVYSTISAVGNIDGKLFVDCLTIHPISSEKVAKLVTDSGASFVASPVFGAPPMAEAGQLVFVCAGPKAAVQRLRPYTNGVMGKAEVPMEDEPYGMASTMKIIGNTFVLNMVTQLGEAFTLPEKTGVGAARVKSFVDGLFGGLYIPYDNAKKDAGHAEKLAKVAGMEVKNATTARQYLEESADHVGGAKGDVASIYGAARMKAGLKYENN
ncbi:hypothetical protein SCUP515_12525 [Seiridium cupressi]